MSFVDPHIESVEALRSYGRELKEFPAKLNQLLAGKEDSYFEKKTKPGIWTVRQVIHHLADSHMNAFIRMKLALTEKTPTIKPYLESDWAELPDSVAAPVALSLQLLEAVHTRFWYTIEGMQKEHLHRDFLHPEMNRKITIATLIPMYVWHGEHHYGYIKEVI